MSDGSVLSVSLNDLRTGANKDVPATAANRTLAEAEREHILEVLEQVGWVVAGREGAAARLGMPRSSLMYKMQKLGIVKSRPTAAVETFAHDANAPKGAISA